MNIEELVVSIREDLNKDKSYDRYPVRFFGMGLSVNSAKELMELRNILSTVSKYPVEIVDVQNFLPYENGWIPIDRFRKIIYEFDKDKSYIVVGFSEYVRFLSEEAFITLILSLLELENDAFYLKRRIYFPCFSLFSQLGKIVKEKHRRLDVYNPLLNELNIEDLPKMFFVDSSLGDMEYENEIQTSKEWFALWKSSDIDIYKPIICTSRTLFYYYDMASSNNVYNIKKIASYTEFLSVIYNIPNLVECQPDSDLFMKKLIQLVSQKEESSFETIVLKELNTQSITHKNLYILWKNASIFNCWLMQNYILIYGDSSSYIYDVMSRMESLTLDELKLRIYGYSGNFEDEKKIQERKDLINTIKRVEGNVLFTDRMISYYKRLIRETIQTQTTIDLEGLDFKQEIKVPKDQLKEVSEGVNNSLLPIITDSGAFERQLIIWLYRANILDRYQIAEVYPGLIDYLTGSDLIAPEGDETERLDSYFSEYRKCRTQKGSGCIYEQIISKWNSGECEFYSWYTNSKIKYPESILKEKKFNGRIYVIDGLGAEFLGYMAATLIKEKMEIIHCEYAKVHLPSITSVAKEYYDSSYRWITIYDQDVVHGKTYYHVENLENSLSIIRNILKEIVAESGEDEFAIIADHGASAGHKFNKKEKKYNFSNAEHDGRCYLLRKDEKVNKENDYMIYTTPDNQNWLMALTAQSLYKSSKYEVHGGATPEEVIVPVVIAKKATTTIVSYKVKPEKLKVSGLDKKISVKIRPMPKEVLLTARDGTNCNMNYNEDSKEWYAALKRGIAQKIEIHVGNQVVDFRTIPSTKMGVDDGFDD